MNTVTINKDITVFCVKAKSFPAGIQEAHDTLRSLIPFDPARKLYGISAPDKSGAIIYRAAAEELKEGELAKHKLETFTIKRGVYIYSDVKEYKRNAMLITNAFKELLSNPKIDPDGYCLECYINDTDCRCMVKINV